MFNINPVMLSFFGEYYLLAVVALPILASDKMMDIIYLAEMLVESAGGGSNALDESSRKLTFQLEFCRKLWLQQPLDSSIPLVNLIYNQVSTLCQARTISFVFSL